MFHILSAWVKAAPIDNNVEVGKSLVSHIKLSLIEPEYLNNQVKKCGFVDLKYVQDAQEEIQLMLANQSIDDKERVIIENAGHTVVNGTYVRMEEDIGLGDEEIVFVREAEDELDQDLGLYLWNGQWAISSCVDYSNIFYTCGVLDTKKTCSSRLKPPKSGWKPVSGCEPPPICTWKPGKGDNKSKLAESRLAPTLDELKGSTSKSIVPAISDVAKGDHAEYTNLTLSEMMNLPTDEEFECFDYEFEGDDEVEAHLGGNQKRDRRMLLSRAAGSAAGGRRISVEET